MFVLQRTDIERVIVHLCEMLYGQPSHGTLGCGRGYDVIVGVGLELLEHEVDGVFPGLELAVRDGLRDFVEVGFPDFVEGAVGEG